MTQLMVAFPLCGLFELSIILIKVVDRKREKEKNYEYILRFLNLRQMASLSVDKIFYQVIIKSDERY